MSSSFDAGMDVSDEANSACLITERSVDCDGTTEGRMTRDNPIEVRRIALRFDRKVQTCQVPVQRLANNSPFELSFSTAERWNGERRHIPLLDMRLEVFQVFDDIVKS